MTAILTAAESSVASEAAIYEMDAPPPPPALDDEFSDLRLSDVPIDDLREMFETPGARFSISVNFREPGGSNSRIHEIMLKPIGSRDLLTVCASLDRPMNHWREQPAR